MNEASEKSISHGKRYIQYRLTIIFLITPMNPCPAYAAFYRTPDSIAETGGRSNGDYMFDQYFIGNYFNCNGLCYKSQL